MLVFRICCAFFLEHIARRHSAAPGLHLLIALHHRHSSAVQIETSFDKCEYFDIAARTQVVIQRENLIKLGHFTVPLGHSS